MINEFDVQQVCLNGHQITTQYNCFPQSRENYCSKCHERTIHECPKCQHPIRGSNYTPGIKDLLYKQPYYEETNLFFY